MDPRYDQLITRKRKKSKYDVPVLEHGYLLLNNQCNSTQPPIDNKKEFNLCPAQERIVFSDVHLNVLNRFFEHNNYPDDKERSCIALATGLPDPQIRIWFQNKRATKKKNAEEFLALPPESQKTTQVTLPSNLMPTNSFSRQNTDWHQGLPGIGVFNQTPNNDVKIPPLHHTNVFNQALQPEVQNAPKRTQSRKRKLCVTKQNLIQDTLDNDDLGVESLSNMNLVKFLNQYGQENPEVDLVQQLMAMDRKPGAQAKRGRPKSQTKQKLQNQQNSARMTNCSVPQNYMASQAHQTANTVFPWEEVRVEDVTTNSEQQMQMVNPCSALPPHMQSHIPKRAQHPRNNFKQANSMQSSNSVTENQHPVHPRNQLGQFFSNFVPQSENKNNTEQSAVTNASYQPEEDDNQTDTCHQHQVYAEEENENQRADNRISEILQQMQKQDSHAENKPTIKIEPNRSNLFQPWTESTCSNNAANAMQQQLVNNVQNRNNNSTEVDSNTRTLFQPLNEATYGKCTSNVMKQESASNVPKANEDLKCDSKTPTVFQPWNENTHCNKISNAMEQLSVAHSANRNSNSTGEHSNTQTLFQPWNEYTYGKNTSNFIEQQSAKAVPKPNSGCNKMESIGQTLFQPWNESSYGQTSTDVEQQPSSNPKKTNNTSNKMESSKPTQFQSNMNQQPIPPEQQQSRVYQEQSSAIPQQQSGIMFPQQQNQQFAQQNGQAYAAPYCQAQYSMPAYQNPMQMHQQQHFRMYGQQPSPILGQQHPPMVGQQPNIQMYSPQQYMPMYGHQQPLPVYMPQHTMPMYGQQQMYQQQPPLPMYQQQMHHQVNYPNNHMMQNQFCSGPFSQMLASNSPKGSVQQAIMPPLLPIDNPTKMSIETDGMTNIVSRAAVPSDLPRDGCVVERVCYEGVRDNKRILVDRKVSFRSA